MSVPTRTAFLDAIESMVDAEGSLMPVFQARVVDIVTAAGPGYTRGSFTHHWETRRDFEVDALRHLAARHASGAADRVRLAASDLLERAASVPPMEELIEVAVDAASAAYAEGSSMAIMMGLWSLAFTDRELAQILDESWRVANESFEEQLSLILAIYRLQVKADWELINVAYVITSNVASFAARRSVSGDDGPLTPRLQATMMLAAIEAMTEPLDDAA